MFLVTIADQRFWKKDEKILFLGEWCKIYTQYEYVGEHYGLFTLTDDISVFGAIFKSLAYNWKKLTKK